MIIFYNKETGKIEGTIDGRVHTEDHLKMWVGDLEKTARLIVNWNPVRYYDESGNLTDKEEERYAADFEADHPQKELFVDFETGVKKIRDYKIDLNTLQLIPIEANTTV